jgi:hypothetical protein
MKFGGIDLHSNNSGVSSIDKTDKVVCEKLLSKDLEKTLGFLELHRASSFANSASTRSKYL